MLEIPATPQQRRAAVPIPRIGFCAEKNRLRNEFLKSIQKLNALHSQQTQAVIAGDPDFSRLDRSIRLAQQKKDDAKYAWMEHVEIHQCEAA